MNRRHWFGEQTIEQLPALRRYARVLAGEQHADDLVQEALAHAYAAQDHFELDRSLRNWLLTILHNCFVSSWRRSRVEGAAIEHLRLHGTTHISPNQEHAVQVGEVVQAFATLPMEQRSVLHLVVVEGLTYAETARVFSVPVGTVMSRLARARAALRRATEGHAPSLKIVRGRSDGTE